MDKLEIDMLPSKVQSGIITKVEAGNLLWQEIYQKPALFGLQSFTEDQKSDFLLSYHNKLYSIFEIFREGKLRFYYFLKKDIEMMKISWLRNMESMYIKEELNTNYVIQTLEPNIYEKEISDSLDTKTSITKTKKVPRKKLTIARITSIILLMKSCHVIDDQIIKNVADFTGLTFEYLSDLTEKMKSLTAKNTLKRQKIIERRDNAFFFHRRYTISLRRSIKNSGSYLRLLSQYNFKTRSWKHQNELLRHRFKNTPSNSMIANQLGLTERKIAFYIKQASKEKSSFRIETMKFLNEAFK